MESDFDEHDTFTSLGWQARQIVNELQLLIPSVGHARERVPDKADDDDEDGGDCAL